MIRLRKITEDNFLDAFQLKLAVEQENYVSHPIRSLAQAYVYREQCQPFGIYIRTKPFGTSNKVTLTCNRDNQSALHLYHRAGFVETGATDGDEIELSQIME